MPIDQTPEDTQPVIATPESIASTSEAEAPPPRRSRRRWLWYVLVYLFVILAVSGIAFAQGRQSNFTRRQNEISQFLKEQFDLGIQDLQAGQYELARQRFEAIARYDPSFPGLEDILVKIYVEIEAPTITPTFEPTPTPDPAPPEELFAQAQTALAEEDWTTVINKLLALRAKDPTYRSLKADGMMYIALRNRGMYRISQGLMEEGLYDLSLAERFGPLDREASFSWSLAQQYLLANSYLGVNWARAAELFGPLCAQGATLDSCYKYAEAAWFYGDQLINASDPCAAMEQYDASLTAWENGTRVPTATKAARACEKATAPPPPADTETPTPDETMLPETPFTPEITATETPSSTPKP